MTTKPPYSSIGLARCLLHTMLMVGPVILMAPNATLAADFYEAKRGPQPRHLIPVDPKQDDYDQRLAEHLFSTDGSFGRMLVLPSFEPEFCISVHADIPDSSIQKHGGWWMVPDEEKDYFITFTTASESLWYSMADNNHNQKKETREVKVARVDRKISLDLAVAIQRVWAKALLLTRYPAEASVGLDGVTYQFSIWVRGRGDLHGETWSPSRRGLPLNLTNMGLDLIAFIRQDEKGKEMTEQKLVKKLRKLESIIPKASR